MDTGKHFEDKGFFHSFRQEVSHRTFRGMIQSQILLDFLFIFVQRQLCRDGIRSVTKIFELDLADWKDKKLKLKVDVCLQAYKE